MSLIVEYCDERLIITLSIILLIILEESADLLQESSLTLSQSEEKFIFRNLTSLKESSRLPRDLQHEVFSYLEQKLDTKYYLIL